MREGGANTAILCSLGWHRPGGAVRWNAGYYFAHCERCGHDLVRTAYGSWQVPRGFRVVWQSTPPPEMAPPQLVAADGAAEGSGRLPIEEVLRHLDSEPPPPETAAEAPPGADAPVDDPAPEQASEPDADEETRHAEEAFVPGALVPGALVPGASEAPEAPPPAPPAPAADEPRHVSPIPDFMDDNPDRRWSVVPRSLPSDASDWAHFDDADSGRTPLGLSGSYRGRDGDAEPGATHPRRRFVMSSLFRARGLQPGSGIPGAAGRWASRSRSLTPGELALGISLLVGIGLIALAIAVFWQMWPDPAETPTTFAAAEGSGVPDTPPAAASAPAAAARLPDTGEPAFVTAGLLNCRAAPSQQTAVVRRLERGDRVRLIAAAEPGWASVAHQGRQCWVASRYLAREEPL